MSQTLRMLVSQGRITAAQSEQAASLMSQYGQTAGYHLIALGAISDEELLEFFVSTFSSVCKRRMDLENVPLKTISSVTRDIARDLRVVPIKRESDKLTLAITDAGNTDTVEEVSRLTNCRIYPIVISEADMTWALQRYYDIIFPAADQAPGPGTAPEPANEWARSTKPAASNNSRYRNDYVIKVSEEGWDLDIHGEGSADKSNLFSEEGQERVAPVVITPIMSEPVSPVESALESALLDPSPPKTTLPAAPIAYPEREPMGAQSSTGLETPMPLAPISSPAEIETAPSDTNSAPQGRSTDKSALLEAVREARTRNDIIAHALEYLLDFSGRAAFFVVKKTEIRGFEIAGDLTCRSAIRSYWVPLSSESTLRHAVDEQSIHIGPLGRNAADGVLAAALGGRPKEIIVIPIEIRKRVIGLLYADHLHETVPPSNLLEELAQTVSTSLANLIA